MNTIQVEGSNISSNFNVSIDNNTITLNDVEVVIIYKKSNQKLTFNITGNVKIFEFLNNDTSIENIYNIDPYANLYINRFGNNVSLKTDINLGYKSNIKYKYSCINENDNNVSINVYHNDMESTSKIINYGLNMTSSKLMFLVNCTIYNKSINSKTTQDSKIIVLKDNNSSIKPNLIIDTDLMDATHSCYIGSFKNDEMFYLKSRGITEKEAIKLLSKSFILGNMDIEENLKDMILKIFEDVWR